MVQFHRHRLVPGYAGGTYDHRNVIRVNVAMHAFLHDQLWRLYGRIEDKLASEGLAGLIGKDEIVAEIHRLTGPKISAALTGRSKSTGARANMSRAKKGRPLSPSHRANVIRALTGRVCSEDTRQRHRLALKGKYLGRVPWNKGKPGYKLDLDLSRPHWKHTDAWKAKVSAKMRGNKHAVGTVCSAARRAALSAGMLGKKHGLGYRHTEEAKMRIAAAQRGVKHSTDRRAKMTAARRNKSLLTGSV